jgi:hypothetical protein
MKVWHVALAVLVSVNTISIGAEHVVEIRLHGRYYTEPATVRVTVAVQPDETNRVLVVQADGERMFRSSEVSLEGDKSRRLHTLEFKNLPKGSYVLRAEVHSSAKMRGAAEELLVVGDVGDSR